MSLGKDILICKARLTDKKKQLEEMTMRADSYIIILRDIFDPYTEDFTQLDIDRAVVIINDFNRLWTEAKELKAQIARMEKDLNG
ncbi:MAG: hypothetical protein AB1553_00525 [Nitrospirota bacterium]